MAVSIEEIKKMCREDFEEQKIAYLELVCKTLKIPYYNGKTHIKKSEMVDRIVSALGVEKCNIEQKIIGEEIIKEVSDTFLQKDGNDERMDVVSKENDGSESEIDKVDNNGNDCDNENEMESDSDSQNGNEKVKTINVEKPKPEVKESGPWEKRDVSQIIEKSDEGTLMAFLDLNGKIRTAALVNRSSKRREVKLVTEFGMEFIVPYDNVLWVRISNRWPRGIYNLLKNGGEIIVNE